MKINFPYISAREYRKYPHNLGGRHKNRCSGAMIKEKLNLNLTITEIGLDTIYCCIPNMSSLGWINFNETCVLVFCLTNINITLGLFCIYMSTLNWLPSWVELGCDNLWMIFTDDCKSYSAKCWVCRWPDHMLCMFMYNQMKVSKSTSYQVYDKN